MEGGGRAGRAVTSKVGVFATLSRDTNLIGDFLSLPSRFLSPLGGATYLFPDRLDLVHRQLVLRQQFHRVLNVRAPDEVIAVEICKK